MIHVAIMVGTQGRGSNMRAIDEAIFRNKLDAKITVVIAPSKSPAAEIALDLGLKCVFLPYNTENYSQRLIETLKENKVELVCLAGYDRKIQPVVLEAFPDRILNIHPSLLPKFGGKGMFGLKVHEAVIDAGETITGCTVHLVDDEYDHGRIILQASLPVQPHDDIFTLDTKVVMTEHDTYWRAIALMDKELNASIIQR